jgi:hypothetical protein
MTRRLHALAISLLACSCEHKLRDDTRLFCADLAHQLERAAERWRIAADPRLDAGPRARAELALSGTVIGGPGEPARSSSAIWLNRTFGFCTNVRTAGREAVLVRFAGLLGRFLNARDLAAQRDVLDELAKLAAVMTELPLAD